MTREVAKYFEEQYRNAGFRVAYGSWPKFKTTKDVDKWMRFMETMVEEKKAKDEE